MPILLTGIRETSPTIYELQFLDEGQPVVFSFVYHPERRRCAGNQEFFDHFEGRASGRDALLALGMVIEGCSVSFPIELRQTGGTNRL
jgi:hypothetical protein